MPGITYFTVRESDNKIVGMVNLRHYLNDYLKKLESKLIPVEIFGITSPPFLFLAI